MNDVIVRPVSIDDVERVPTLEEAQEQQTKHMRERRGERYRNNSR